jgi:ABC-type antimicrobial peptide transport system permease subunit
MSFLVARRTREVAVRMAIGAQARDVIRMVVRRGLVLAAVGSVIGLGLAAAVTRFAEALLFGVSPLDTGVFVIMALAALGVAALASWVPARRAAHIDPMRALREE